MRTILGKLQLRHRCSHSSGSGIESSLCLVALLLAHHALFKQVVEAFKGLARDFLGGLGLVNHVLGGLYKFFTCATLHFLVLACGNVLHLLSFRQGGLGSRRVDLGKALALVHIVTLLDIDLGNAASKFARHAHHIAVGLTLNSHVGRLEVEQAPHCQAGNHSHQNEHCHDERQSLGLPNLAALSLLGFFFLLEGEWARRCLLPSILPI